MKLTDNPETEADPHHRLFVTNLPKEVTLDKLEKFFLEYGKMKKLTLVSGTALPKITMYAKIHFEKETEAVMYYLEKVRDCKLGEKYLTMMIAKDEHDLHTKIERIRRCRVYIKKVPEFMSDEILRKIFSEYGELTDVYSLERDSEKGSGNRSGFAVFKDDEAIEKIPSKIQFFDMEIKWSSYYNCRRRKSKTKVDLDNLKPENIRRIYKKYQIKDYINERTLYHQGFFYVGPDHKPISEELKTEFLQVLIERRIQQKIKEKERIAKREEKLKEKEAGEGEEEEKEGEEKEEGGLEEGDKKRGSKEGGEDNQTKTPDKLLSEENLTKADTGIKKTETPEKQIIQNGSKETEEGKFKNNVKKERKDSSQKKKSGSITKQPEGREQNLYSSIPLDPVKMKTSFAFSHCLTPSQPRYHTIDRKKKHTGRNVTLLCEREEYHSKRSKYGSRSRKR